MEWVVVSASRHDLRSVSFFGVVSCLLVLGIHVFAEVVKAKAIAGTML